ncbi:hypothetical protein HDE_12495 [Halotydeus destructor]|nr:hypothetical protein HDE_12495 [Halotydeus destructor]
MASTSLNELFRIAVRLIDDKTFDLNSVEKSVVRRVALKHLKGEESAACDLEELLLRYLASPILEDVMLANPEDKTVHSNRKLPRLLCGMVTMFTYQIQQSRRAVLLEFMKSEVNTELLRESFTQAKRGCEVAERMVNLVLAKFIPKLTFPASLFWNPGPGSIETKRFFASHLGALEIESCDFNMLNSLNVLEAFEPHYWGPDIWFILHFLATFANHFSCDKAGMLTFFLNDLAYFLPCHQCSTEWTKLCHEELVSKKQVWNCESLDIQHWMFDMHNKVNVRLHKPVYLWSTFLEVDAVIYSNIIGSIFET